MSRRRNRRHLLALVILIVAVLPMPSLSAQQNDSGTYGNASFAQQFLGRDSCSLNTCHGGPIADQVDWTSSLTFFEAHDPHARAGLVLSNKLSKQIIDALLEPRIRSLKTDSREYKTKYNSVLIQRCAACHAPGLASLPVDQLEDASKLRMHYLDGVSCESCHGAAGEWLEPHKRSDFSEVFSERLGMRNTENYLERVAACSRCHVGSRTEDGLVRDMNHDMIAAGHPPLRYDPWAFMQKLPPHWRDGLDSRDGVNASTRTHHLKRFRLGRLTAIREAAKLTQERLIAYKSLASRVDQGVVWPEFSDFDCFACHQRLRAHPISDIGARPLSQRLVDPRYNPFLGSGMSGLWGDARSAKSSANGSKQDIDKYRWRLKDESDLAQVLDNYTELKKEADRLIIHESKQDYEPDLLGFYANNRVGAIKHMFVRDELDRQLDWYDAVAWLMHVQAGLKDSPQRLDDRIKLKFNGLAKQLEFSDQAIGDTESIADSPTDFDLEKFNKLAQELYNLLRAEPQ